MPKIGMPSSSMLLAPWTDAIQVAADNGFDAFEIDLVFPSADLDDITPKDIEHARALSEKTGMEICVHAPFFELNIAAYCRGIREESIRYIKQSIDLCADLGGNTLITHAGDYTYHAPDNATKDHNMAMKIQWGHNIESLKRIHDYATSKGITLCLENLGFNTSIDKTFEHLLEIREKVDGSLKFTLDIGHARLNASGGAKEGIRLLGDNIHHIHFTDNNGKKDDHFAIGDGNFDYSDFFDFIRNFPHIVTLEVVHIGKNPEDILKSREYFNNL